MVLNRYAAGDKVYNGGSNAATRGTVDPQGYVERSLAQRNNSQTRSGHAAAALRRLDRNRPGGNRQGNRNQGGQRNQQGQRNGPRRNGPRRNGQRDNRPNRNNQPGQRDNRPNQGGGNKPKGNGKPKTPGINKTPSYPVVKISPNGQLNLPWNFQNNVDAINAQGTLNQGLLGLQEQEQGYMRDWTDTARQAEQEYDQIQDATRNDFAARGLVQSSPYGQAVVENSTNFNNYMTDLNTDQTNFMAEIAKRRLGIENQFNDVLRALGIGNISSAADRAGDLGYGRSQTRGPKKKSKGPDKKPGGKKPGNKGGKGKKDGKKPPKVTEAERRERRREKRRNMLTGEIQTMKAGPRRRRLRERRLDLRLKDTRPGKLKRKLTARDEKLERQIRRDVRATSSEGNKDRRTTKKSSSNRNTRRRPAGTTKDAFRS